MSAKSLTTLGIGHYNAEFDGTSLGHTLGGSEFSYDPQYVDVKVDDYGDTPVDKKATGEIVKVKLRLAQTDLATLSQIMPQATLDGDRLDGGTIAGTSLRASAGVLKLTPAIAGAGEIIHLWKAHVASVVTLSNKIDEQSVTEIEFFAFPDTDKADGEQLFTIGDTSA